MTKEKETGTEVEEQIRKMQETYISSLPENIRVFWETIGILPRKPEQKKEKQEKAVKSQQVLPTETESDSIVKTMLKQVEINKKMTEAYLLYLEATENTLQLMANMEKFTLFPCNRK